MNPSELIEQRLRLQRKLSTAYEGWHSGRVDRLADALRSVERQLRDRQIDVGATDLPGEFIRRLVVPAAPARHAA